MQMCIGEGIFTPCPCDEADAQSSPTDVNVEASDVSVPVDLQSALDPGVSGCTGPMVWYCQDEHTLHRCVDGVMETQPCAEGELCLIHSCKEIICVPGESECTGPETLRKCDESGTEWYENLHCDASADTNAFCDPISNECVCELPVHVLFVLDASGSMQMEEVSPGVTQWDTALAAIATMMEEYPFLTYGLSTFPNQIVNCSAEYCEGGGGCGYTGGVNFDLAQGQVQSIKDYLATRQLSTDPNNLEYVLTPLLGMMNYLADTYPETGPLKDHPYPAYIVLLSDGQDSCHNPVNSDKVIGPLAQVTTQLLEQHTVKTFAIGFNLESGQSQLNAMAMHGGTGQAQYIPANNLTTLLAALTTIFDSMDIRNCDTWQDATLPPACTDVDEDGWCAYLDCDDTAATAHPAALEIEGNGADDDCDGLVDEGNDDALDQDGDGFSPAQGDCADFDPMIGPGAFEVPLDGFDNDCDGTFDEAGCECGPTTGATTDVLACASELSCNPTFVISTSSSSPTGDEISTAMAAVSHFGSANNDLQPKEGNSYALVATGPATGTSHSTDLSGWNSMIDPYSDSSNIYDVVEFKVEMQAPYNAQGFSIDYVFFSEEYDDFVGTNYNDKFYMILNAPQTTGGQNQVINFTDCRNPSSYYDLNGADCPLASGYCCYIAINTALSECCWYNGCPDGTWTTDISGTGFSCAPSSLWDSSDTGSSTGWLTTSWTIQPGEVFTLIFHVHDTSDGIYDSEVILDNFRWHATPTTPGTEPTN
jgi:hypothetical protein